MRALLVIFSIATAIAFLVKGLCFAEKAPMTATLIVNYSAPHAERLDRVRFRLFNEKQKGVLFPRRSHSDLSQAFTRQVSISNLPAGTYLIEFLIPNYDGLFAEVPKQKVILAAGAIVLVNQEIEPVQITIPKNQKFAAGG